MAKRKKKLTVEEMFPHDGFPFRLEFPENGHNKICWFTHEVYLTKHINKYRIEGGKIDAAPGYSLTPPKPKRASPKSKATKPKAPAKPTKAKPKSKPAKPKAPAKPAKPKRSKKKIFSTLETFFD